MAKAKKEETQEPKYSFEPTLEEIIDSAVCVEHEHYAIQLTEEMLDSIRVRHSKYVQIVSERSNLVNYIKEIVNFGDTDSETLKENACNAIDNFKHEGISTKIAKSAIDEYELALRTGILNGHGPVYHLHDMGNMRRRKYTEDGVLIVDEPLEGKQLLMKIK